MQAGLLRQLCLTAACAILASCGGGGGGGGDAHATAADASTLSTVTFTPSSLQIIQTQGFEETIRLQASISPEPLGSQFFAIVAIDQPLFQPGLVAVTPNDDESATVSMTTESGLVAGRYEGQVTLHLCRDAQCRDEVNLAGNVLPYSIQVLPRVQLQVSGAAVPSGSGGPYDFQVAPDAVVIITSNLPVTWSRGSSITGADLQVISSTPTRWEGRIVGRSGLFIGVVADSIDKPVNNGAQVTFHIQ